MVLRRLRRVPGATGWGPIAWKSKGPADPAGPHRVAASGGTDAGAGVAALQRTTLVLAQAAPDTVVLAGFQCPGEALLTHVATTAHLLGLLDLHDRGPGVADGEEQFRVLIEANGPVAPIHGGSHLSR